MENWSRINFKELEESEEYLIYMSDMNLKPFRIYLDDPEGNSIFGYAVGNINEPPLVMLHGYMGSSIIFYKMLKHLSVEFRIYCLDLMGMGRSSRPTWDIENPDDAELLFVEPIEICREKLGLEKMVLAGHSFGGYIAGCYAQKYSSRVVFLYMISPVGVGRASENSEMEGWEKKQSWGVRVLTKIFGYFYERDATPGTFLRFSGPLSGAVVQKYINVHKLQMTKVEAYSLASYLEEVNLYPGCGEYAFRRLFDSNSYAIWPLWDRIPEELPTAYYFGENDWVKPDGAYEHEERVNEIVSIDSISESGHHMYAENYGELCAKMLKAYLKFK